MKFIDEAKIKVTTSKGSNGATSLRCEKFVLRGDPDGGDSGKGDSVWAEADEDTSIPVEHCSVRHY